MKRRSYTVLNKTPRGGNRLVPMDESLKELTHTISPHKHCHQSPKHLRDKYALTPVISNVQVTKTLIDGGAGLNVLSVETFDSLQVPYDQL